MLPELGLRPDARLPTKASLKLSGCSISLQGEKAEREIWAANGLPTLPFNNLVPRHHGL